MANVACKDQEASLQSLQDAVVKAQTRCIEKQWKLSRNGKTIILRDVLAKLLGWLNRFMSIGDVVVQYDPSHAALPWAGVKFLVQVGQAVLYLNSSMKHRAQV